MFGVTTNNFLLEITKIDPVLMETNLVLQALKVLKYSQTKSCHTQNDLGNSNDRPLIPNRNTKTRKQPKCPQLNK